MKTQISSLADFQTKIQDNEDLRTQFQTDPIKAINNIEYKPTTYRWIYRITVGVLGLTILIILIGIFLLSLYNKEKPYDVPAVLTALASASIGAIAGLLASSPSASV